MTDQMLQVKTLKFSPLLLSRAVIDTLRYFFKTFSVPELRWSPDPKESQIVIDTINDIIGPDAIQKKPRILVRRDQYIIKKTSLSGDMTSAKSMGITHGVRDSRHMNFVEGGITIIIEGYSEGTVEILADAVSHFLTWASDHVCNMFSLNKFGYPMYISETTLDKENDEKFKIVLSTSYSAETRWVLKEDAIKLNGLFLDLQHS